MSEKKRGGRRSGLVPRAGRRGYWTRRAKFRRIKAGLAKIGYAITPSCLFSSCGACGRHQAHYCLEIYSTRRAGGSSTF